MKPGIASGQCAWLSPIRSSKNYPCDAPPGSQKTCPDGILGRVNDHGVDFVKHEGHSDDCSARKGNGNRETEKPTPTASSLWCARVIRWWGIEWGVREEVKLFSMCEEMHRYTNTNKRRDDQSNCPSKDGMKSKYSKGTTEHCIAQLITVS